MVWVVKKNQNCLKGKHNYRKIVQICLFIANFRHNTFLTFTITGFNMLNMISFVNYHNIILFTLLEKSNSAKIVKRKNKLEIKSQNMLIFDYSKPVVKEMKQIRLYGYIWNFKSFKMNTRLIGSSWKLEKIYFVYIIAICLFLLIFSINCLCNLSSQKVQKMPKKQDK